MTKEEVTIRCAEIFFKDGTKISTDELSKLIGISKRTLYEMFSSKEDLILACTQYAMSRKKEKLDQYHAKMQSNVICMILPVSDIELNNSLNKYSRFIHEVQKYYPDIYHTIVEAHSRQSREILQHMIERGQKEGIFDNRINASLMSIVFTSSCKETMEGILNYNYSGSDVYHTIFAVVLKGMCTPKGMEILNSTLDQEKETIINNINTYISKKR